MSDSQKKKGLPQRIIASGVPLFLIRLLIGGFFIFLGTKKIMAEPQAFLKAVKEYNLLPLDPPYLINVASVVVPWIEVIVGAALVTGIYLRGAALTFMVMLAAFTTAVFIRALGVYEDGSLPFCTIKFDCGCGQGEVIICEKLSQNGLLFLLGVPILLSRSRHFCLRPRGKAKSASS